MFEGLYDLTLSPIYYQIENIWMFWHMTFISHYLLQLPFQQMCAAQIFTIYWHWSVHSTTKRKPKYSYHQIMAPKKKATDKIFVITESLFTLQLILNDNQETAVVTHIEVCRLLHCCYTNWDCQKLWRNSKLIWGYFNSLLFLPLLHF